MREPTAEPRPKLRRALPLQRMKMQRADMQRQTMHTMYSHTACSSHGAADRGSRFDVYPLAAALVHSVACSSRVALLRAEGCTIPPERATIGTTPRSKLSAL